MRWLPVFAAVLFACCTQPDNARVQVLIGGTLIDGKGGDPIEHSVVVVEDGKVRAAGTQVHTPIPAGSKKIDTSGMTVRPVAGGTLAPGEPANLELVRGGDVTRRMNSGQWQ